MVYKDLNRLTSKEKSAKSGIAVIDCMLPVSSTWA